MREKIVEPGTKPRPGVLPASELGSYSELQLQTQLIARCCSVSIGHAELILRHLRGGVE